MLSGISHVLGMMDQLTSGLMLFGVLDQIRNHRGIMCPFLTIEGVGNFIVTADMILDNLKVEFSPDGSNKKLEEINIHKYFCDYVQEADARDGKDHDHDHGYTIIY